jgi:hypothetical protein
MLNAYFQNRLRYWGNLIFKKKNFKVHQYGLGINASMVQLKYQTCINSLTLFTFNIPCHESTAFHATTRCPPAVLQ